MLKSVIFSFLIYYPNGSYIYFMVANNCVCIYAMRSILVIIITMVS